ncbi:CsbD family protein [Massilia horti]|uniref:CsbD family protein n=1 Tax=Massilia horti TaxID=2562153 RepID=A0A4Y9SW71_9BURK|nr:CsbD family protein [Massilia horti]TFW29599.1 CsbD family protein [Massilia horti]
MNSDQIKGKAKDIAGKVQEKVGEVVGSRQQEVKGQSKQVEGKLQEKAGDLKQDVKDTFKGNC